jgi:hypothetical protein
MDRTSTLSSMADGIPCAHAILRLYHVPMQDSDYAVLPELLDLAQAISQLAEDLLRMLPEVWRRAVHLSVNTRHYIVVTAEPRGPTFILYPS